MAQRTVGLMSTLLELHRVHEPAELLPLLLQRTTPEYGRAVAVCYLLDGRTGNFRLEFLADADGTVDLNVWEHELNAPVELPHALAMPALAELATADPVTLTGPLPTMLAGFWPRNAADQVQRGLGLRFAAAAPIWMTQGPIGLVLLLVQEHWPVGAAAECAAHSASALGRLLERRSALQADSTPLMRDVIEQIAAREINRAERYGRVFSVAVFEPDGEGETQGPQIDVAALAAHVMRQPDTVGHLDQRRVIVLLPETPATGAEVFRRRVHRAASPQLLPLHAGVATFPEDGATLADLIQLAESRRRTLELLPEAERVEPAPLGTHERRRREAIAARQAGIEAADADGPTVRVRIAPLQDTELPSWKMLIDRLPSAITAEPCGFDGFAGLFDIRAQSVTRLLTDLQRLAQKIGADLTPTITGEIGLTLRASEQSARSRAASERVRDFAGSIATANAEREERRRVRPAPEPRRRSRRPILVAVAGLAAAVVAAGGFFFYRGADERGTTATARTPSPGTVTQLVRDLSGSCLPEPGAAACDPLRQGLWSGDIRTWQDWGAITGGPKPDARDVTARTIAMHLSVYDPSTRVDLARVQNVALPVITAVIVREIEGRSLINGVEIGNLGTVEADLAGLVLPAGLGRFSGRSILPPGERCAAGPDAGDHACPFSIVDSAPSEDLATAKHLQLVAAGGLVLDDFVLP